MNPPLTLVHLFGLPTLPWLTAAVFLIAWVPVLGVTSAVVVAIVYAFAASAVGGAMAFRSWYGVAQMRCAIWWLAGQIAYMVLACCAVPPVLFWDASLVQVLSGLVGVLVLWLLVGVWSYRRRRARLVGQEAEWLATVVQPSRGRVSYSLTAQNSPPLPFVRPWIAGVAAVWIYHALVASSAVEAAMPILMFGLVVSVAWMIVAFVGPGLADAAVLARAQREAGVVWVHADLEALQALRRSFFLSRWLAPANPPQLTQAPPARSVRRRSTRR